MIDAISAYRSQIEAAGLPVSGTEEDAGWTTITFKYEFVIVTLSIPEDDPTYCRIMATFSLKDASDEVRLDVLSRANDNTEQTRLVKTTVGFEPAGRFVRFACEFFTDAATGYAIKPELRTYLRLLGNASATFGKRGGSPDASPDA